MSRYVLSPEAASDLAQIWRYIKEESSVETADRVETTIREKIAFLAGMPGVGHRRQDLTSSPVRFFAVYSYLIVYRPEARPLQVAAILHGNRRRPGMQDARGRLPPRLGAADVQTGE